MKMGVEKNLLRNQIVKNINSFTKVAVYTKSCVWKKKINCFSPYTEGVV